MSIYLLIHIIHICNYLHVYVAFTYKYGYFTYKYIELYIYIYMIQMVISTGMKLCLNCSFTFSKHSKRILTFDISYSLSKKFLTVA